VSNSLDSRAAKIAHSVMNNLRLRYLGPVSSSVMSSRESMLVRLSMLRVSIASVGAASSSVDWEEVVDMIGMDCSLVGLASLA